MKRISFFLAVLLLLSILCIPVLADDYPLLVDNADLLDEMEENLLASKLQDISNRYGCPVAVLTVDDYDWSDAQDYADIYFEEHYGFNADGVVFFIAMETREWHVSTSGRVIDVVSAKRLGRIENEVVPYLSSESYYTAFVKYAELMDVFLADPTGENDPVEPINWSGPIILSIIVGLLFGAIRISGLKSQMKSVVANNQAGEYVKEGTFNLVKSSDTFLYRTVSRTARQTSSSSGGGSHHSSSGGSHGGGGGHF